MAKRRCSNKARNQVKWNPAGAAWFVKNTKRRRARNKIARVQRRINRQRAA
jgi:hypothetical protein